MTDAETEYRIAIGSWVSARLARHPAVSRIPSADLDIFVVRDFLDAGQCAGLIRLIDSQRIPSQLLSPSEDPEFRTSESCNMEPGHPLVREVEDKITGLIGIDPVQGETIQGQRYAIGQQFKAHHDFFHADQPYWPEMQKCGGQRTWTAMVFLNAPEAGGQTEFESAGIKVTPRAGNLLTWNNLDAAGQPNPFSLHRGWPVTAGVKYIITKWYRERPWTYSDAPLY